MSACSLKDVARATGLAVSTVSYALRGAPNIPAATALRVREAAERLGYRVNARVAELMAQVRSGRVPAAGDRLALVWVEARSRRGAGDEVAKGARARAEERGYGMEEFDLDEAGARPGRLADILVSRGIAGVVLGPVFRRANVELAWPWERFAMAVVGAAEWSCELSRATHHHYEAMRLALREAERAGARRPAAWVDAETNERAHRGWQAAWLAYAGRSAAARLWLGGRPSEAASAARWLEMVRPDAVVVSDGRRARGLRQAGWRGGEGSLLTLDWRPEEGLPGVDQGYGTIAAHAVDLVIAQLQRNERGPPQPPRVLCFPGRWRGLGRADG